MPLAPFAGKPRPPRPRSGMLVCLALSIFAAMVVTGFYVASKRLHHRPAPRAPFGVSAKPLLVAVFDFAGRDETIEKMADRLRAGNPDLVCLCGVDGRQLGALAASWAQEKFTPFQAFYPSKSSDDSDRLTGVAILSRFPLFESRAIPNHMHDAFGVWAACVVDGQKFYVASVRFSDATSDSSRDRDDEFINLLRAWESLGSPPMIVGGWIGAGVPAATGPLQLGPRLGADGNGVLITNAWHCVPSTSSETTVELIPSNP